jgi:hypothetical protein
MKLPFLHFYAGRAWHRREGYVVGFAAVPRPDCPLGDVAYRFSVNLWFCLPALRITVVRK